MDLEQTQRWMIEKIAAHAAKHRKRKRRFQQHPNVSALMFKLSLHRLALQTVANREFRGWTRRQLAQRARLPERLVRMVEHGKSFGVSIHTLYQLAKVFGCALDINFHAVASEVHRLSAEPTPESLLVSSFDDEMSQVAFANER